MIERILGPGRSKEMDSIFQSRFYMDGTPPAGRIVGLLDELCLFIDHPLSYDWQSIFNIDGVIRVHVKTRLIM